MGLLRDVTSAVAEGRQGNTHTHNPPEQRNKAIEYATFSGLSAFEIIDRL